MNHRHLDTGCVLCILFIVLICFSCVGAGREDGFTFHAFEYGPSPLWDLLLMCIIGLPVVIIASIGRVARHGK